jgi:hypothetical protein
MNELTLFETLKASTIGVNKLTAIRGLETKSEITHLFSARPSSNAFGRCGAFDQRGIHKGIRLLKSQRKVAA